jgi:hypothetical protein
VNKTVKGIDENNIKSLLLQLKDQVDQEPKPLEDELLTMQANRLQDT